MQLAKTSYSVTHLVTSGYNKKALLLAYFLFSTNALSDNLSPDQEAAITAALDSIAPEILEMEDFGERLSASMKVSNRMFSGDMKEVASSNAKTDRVRAFGSDGKNYTS